MDIRARTDNRLANAHEAWEYTDPRDEFVANTREEVVATLRAAETAAAHGFWVVGFVAYEAAGAFDDSLTTQPPTDPLPLAWFGVFGRREAARFLDTEANSAQWTLDTDAELYAKHVETLRSEIVSGETYQCNFTGRFRTDDAGDAFSLYQQLARNHGAAYNVFIETDDWAVASASPELFFARVQNEITMRPMKGTIGRGRFAEEDKVKRNALLHSAKDRSENVMIVDLVRNDLGRIANPGSVQVTSLCEAEQFPNVWQLTSTVTADVRSDIELSDVFGAVFPSGSVTGAPKSRTMKLIAEHESSPRGVYCGAVGVIPPAITGGPTVFNVAIRTAVIDKQSGTGTYGAGGGITWESNPDSELAELHQKAAILHSHTPEFRLRETVRVDGEGEWINLGRHLRRLQRSATYFGWQFDVEALRTHIRLLALVDRVVGISLADDGTWQIDPRPTTEPVATVTVALADDPVDTNNVFLFHKTSNRSVYESARNGHDNVDDVILWNQHGDITESTIANIAVRFDNQWHTPPISCGLLAGIGRELALDRGKVRERVIAVEELRTADEIMLISSVRGWRPAALI